MRFLYIATVLLFSLSTYAGIYDADLRFEMDSPGILSSVEITNAAKAVGILIQPLIQENKSKDTFLFPFKPLENTPVYCPHTRFREQRSLGYCTVFLISDDIVATAGHCVRNITSCEKTKLLMNFKYDFAHLSRSINTQNNLAISTDDVYECRNILMRELSAKDGATNDFAVLRLNRPVRGVTPLKVSRQNAAPNDELFTIGHPEGLPKKVSLGAKLIRYGSFDTEMTPLTFRSSISSSPGNSGGPIFNRKTFEVEGIHIASELNFRLNPQMKCMEEVIYNSADANVYLSEDQFIHKVKAFAENNKTSAILQKTKRELELINRVTEISAVKKYLAIAAKHLQSSAITELQILLTQQEQQIILTTQDLTTNFIGLEKTSLNLADGIRKATELVTQDRSLTLKERYLNFLAEKVDPLLYFLDTLNGNIYFFNGIDLNQNYIPLWKMAEPQITEQEILSWKKIGSMDPVGQFISIKSNLDKWKTKNPDLLVSNSNALLLDLQLKNFTANYLQNIDALLANLKTAAPRE